MNVAIRGCMLNLGNIALGIQYNSLDIRNSTLIQVNFTRLGEDYDPSRLSPIMMSNTNFQRGSIKMRYAAVTISQSNLSILSPPLEAGTSATISCSSIIRSPLISQANTSGIVAMDLQLSNSSISQFQVALRVNPTSLNTFSIYNSNFESNSLYNIVNIGQYNVVATGNWWGTTSFATIQAKFNDYWDNINLGEVLFANYSSSKLLAERSCPH